jgi:mono/diheme cytochrome c family protein
MKKSTIWFLFILSIVGWAGWALFGVTTIFSGSTALAAPDGASLYAHHCGACHPNGGNKINPAIPLNGSSKTKSLAVFTAYNRNPLKADGSKGVMPAFPKDKISDQEMKLIYDYCLTLPRTGK